jgi:predicted SprT family Zn-dependent metalloprotease
MVIIDNCQNVIITTFGNNFTRQILPRALKKYFAKQMEYYELVEKSVSQLRAIAKSYSIKPSRLSKHDLVMAIISHSRADASDYRAQCLISDNQKLMNFYKPLQLDWKGKSREEICDELTWLREGNPDPVNFTPCDRWTQIKTIDPRTLRRITPSGKVYAKLRASCHDEYDAANALDGPTWPGTFEENRMRYLEYYGNLFHKIVFNNRLKGKVRVEFTSRFVITGGTTVGMGAGKVVKITISSLIIDSKEKLRDTLIHELCHAAVTVIDHVPNARGHGEEWLKWTRIAQEAFPTLPEITPFHTWEPIHPGMCEECGRRYKRLEQVGKLCIMCTHNKDTEVYIKANPDYPSLPLDVS